jgi:glycosyltransferase involved in cell wall biosynthesis
MPAAPTLFDLTEFLHDPQRSGIQRVCYEIVAHWPPPGRLVPSCVDQRSRLIALAPDVLDVYRDFFTAPKDQLPALRERIGRAARRGGEVVTARMFGRYRGLLNATVFSLPWQVAYYAWAARRGMAGRIFLFVHDVLAWTRPELFTPGFGVNIGNYLRTLRLVPNLAYNSTQTCNETLMRVLRDGRPAGPVFPLGADSLGTASPHFELEKRRFTVVGTMEPRKNHLAVLDAFIRLWEAGADVELEFAGKLGWLAEADARRVLSLRDREPRFRWRDTLGDGDVAAAIRASRATIYPALCEGYGLPPVESLALGVPVIVSDSIPAAAMLPPLGQVRLATPDAEAIGRAVTAMLDDDFARRKTNEIAQLRLPTWSEMVAGVARWVEDPGAVADLPTAVPFARAG